MVLGDRERETEIVVCGEGELGKERGGSGEEVGSSVKGFEVGFDFRDLSVKMG